jgi:serine/threonine-protein kinase RsbW
MSTIALTIPAKPEYVVFCRLVLVGLSRAQHIDPETLSDLKLAVTEACSNAVRHAYTGDEGQVSVRFDLEDDNLAVEVNDEGNGFAFDTSEFEEPGETGMGLAIIRALTEDLDVSVGPDGRGTSVRFRKPV